MSLYKRGRIYWSRIEHDGVVNQQSLRTKNKNTAIELEAALKTSLVTGQYQIAKTCPTLREFEARLFDHLRLHVKPRTLQFYQEQYNILKKSPLGNTQLSLIDAAVADIFKQWRTAQRIVERGVGDTTRERAPSIVTVNHGLRTLRRALHQAEDWHLIVRAPKLKLVPGENQREAILDDDTIDAMIDFARKAYPESVFQYLLPVLVDTGLRISEACRLKRDDTFLGESPTLKVTEGKSRFAKREVPLTSRAVTAIEAAWMKSRGCGYVFTAHGGRRPLTRHYATQQFRILADALNRSDLVLHSLRHTFCTRLGEKGVDAFTIQKLAGHSSITISQRYVHAGRVMMENAIRRLEEKIEPKVEVKPKKNKPGEVTEF